MGIFSKGAFSIVLLSFSSLLFAASGPIILGGDDLDDHGSRSAGVNIDGWAYAESAAGSIISQSSYPSPTIDIAAIGPTDPGAGSYPGGNSGGMVNSVADVLGLTVQWFDSAAAIQQFFTDLGAGTVRPKMIWIVSDGATNDLDSAEEAELALHGPEIASYQLAGGGLLSQEHDYAWLSSLLPGVTFGNCSNPVTLTAAGNAAFPSLSNAQVDAGPCHLTFGGDIGGLDILATESGDRNVIIGGGAGSTFEPSSVAVPTLPFWALVAMVSLIGFFGTRARRRKAA